MTSTAPGQGRTTASLLDDALVRSATEEQLFHTIAVLQAEQHRRALGNDDLDAVIEHAYLEGFTTRGEPVQPWIHNGLLICPGYIRYKSATSHDCVFVSVAGEWVWTRGDTVYDGMREVPGPKTVKQAVTIVHADEGLELDVVTSAARTGGGCQMKKAVSYQIRSGELVVVTTRARTPRGHSLE